MTTWIRFWRWFIKNAESLIAIMLAFVVAVLGTFGAGLSLVLSTILAVLALLAFSTIRDRGVKENEKRSGSRSFEKQVTACHDLINYVNEYRVREAVLLQYSCTTSFDLACLLLDQGANVTIYVQHEEVPAWLGSQGQQERIKQTIRSLQKHVSSNLTKQYHLKLYKYRTIGTISAIKLDNRILSMGCYTYEQVDPSRSKHYGKDKFSISGHDRETIIAFEGSKEFEVFKKTFDAIESEYKSNAEEVQL